MARLYAGTSGFAYPSWKPDFYPAKLPAAKFLEYYSTRVNCVEINYTFRMLPKLSTLTNWVNATPATFVFCPKAHMRLTHILKLKDAASFTELFLKAIDPLRPTGRLGPVLYQLPPTFKADLPLLATYLDLLPKTQRFAFEFRHASWLNGDTYALLRQHNVALCLAESDHFEVPEVITADFVYYRLRKPEYTTEDRARIAANAMQLVATHDIYLFFKHEETPAGALYAEELLAALRPEINR
jgi:uncharacterized protein YecE (DUF72 family)